MDEKSLIKMIPGEILNDSGKRFQFKQMAHRIISNPARRISTMQFTNADNGTDTRIYTYQMYARIIVRVHDEWYFKDRLNQAFTPRFRCCNS